MQQAGEPSDQLAVSARQTNENVTPKRAQAKQTSERKKFNQQTKYSRSHAPSAKICAS